MKTRKILPIILMIIMTVSMLGMTVCANPQARNRDSCFVSTSDGSNLNGRSGPGTEYPVICKYANGTQLGWSVMPENNAIDSQGRRWSHVSGRTTTGATMEAWVCDDYLRFESSGYSLRSIEVENNPNLPAVG